METAYILLLVFVCVIFALVIAVFNAWRRGREEDQGMVDILDFVNRILEAIKEESHTSLREVSQAEVEAAATAIYRQYIRETALANLITEDVFVKLVVEKWKEIVGVQAATVHALTLQRAMTTPGD